MEILLIFLVTSLVSALGSIQLGPVNASVLRLGLEGKIRQSRWLAFGGSVPEFFYAAIAICGEHWLMKWQMLGEWINWFLVPIFLFLGLRMVLTKRKSTLLEPGSKSNQFPFIQGLILGLLNPQLPLFWLSILVWYQQVLGWTFLEFFPRAAFVLGTGCGAFALLLLIAELARSYRARLFERLGRYSPELIFGCFFILMAIAQTIKNLV